MSVPYIRTKENQVLELTAMAILLVLCVSWGLQQVAIKVANRGISPLFGVIAGGVLLNEPITGSLVLALVLVGMGIFLVNRPNAG